MNNELIQLPYTTMIRHLAKIHLDLAGRCFRRYVKHLFFKRNLVANLLKLEDWSRNGPKTSK